MMIGEQAKEKMTMQQLKIQPNLLHRLTIDRQRIKAQIDLMAQNPTAYTGETLAHALTVIQWHLNEQAGTIDSLEGHIIRINRLIDQADVILQRGENGE